MIELEVRCCCQPQKLLGYMEVDEKLVRRGGVVIFERRERIPFVMDPRTIITSLPTPNRLERLRLPIEEFVDRSVAPEARHLALKAEGLSLEDLRRWSQFREARP